MTDDYSDYQLDPAETTAAASPELDDRGERLERHDGSVETVGVDALFGGAPDWWSTDTEQSTLPVATDGGDRA